MSSSARDACTRALERELGNLVSVSPDRLETCAWDFGRLIHRTPVVVVDVHQVEELMAALRIGTQHGMPITTRGSGHNQSGQCLADGALVLNMRGLNRVQIEAERGSAWLSGGATWQQVANTAFAGGWMPVGLTTIVDTTVAGTLSVGGVGSESFRTGMQTDQVLELEVATLEGKLVRCSSEHNRELFDAVRAGLGQCGVIVRARYPLRRAKAHVRTYTLAHAHGRELIADMQVIREQQRCDFMLGALSWNERLGWQVMLFLGKEFDDENELNDGAVVSGLRYRREVGRADDAQWLNGAQKHPFFRSFEEKNSAVTHRPWVDYLCEPNAAAELISAVLSEPAVAPRPGIAGALLGVASHANRAPLIVPRASSPLVLLGLFPEAADAELEATLAGMRRHAMRAAPLGAKRYLSGFLDSWTAREWSAHFDDAWPRLCAMKERFDPRGLLNNQCISWRQ